MGENLSFDKNDDGLIPFADYKQVYEEVSMSVIEALVKHGKIAKISDTPRILKKWVDYFWEEAH